MIFKKNVVRIDKYTSYLKSKKVRSKWIIYQIRHNKDFDRFILILSTICTFYFNHEKDKLEKQNV